MKKQARQNEGKTEQAHGDHPDHAVHRMAELDVSRARKKRELFHDSKRVRITWVGDEAVTNESDPDSYRFWRKFTVDESTAANGALAEIEATIDLQPAQFIDGSESGL